MIIRLELEMGVERWLIEVPDEVALSAKKHQKKFLNFVYKAKNGFYNGGGVCFGLADFVKWLDEYILKKSVTKAKVVSTNDQKLFDEKNDCPTLYF
ncbi:MAG: hypothetical protein FWF76_05780 [Oscillospiraceae bacterium]|nr:hypothetical protein [Oscillospiraceae bacterium]